MPDGAGSCIRAFARPDTKLHGSVPSFGLPQAETHIQHRFSAIGDRLLVDVAAVDSRKHGLVITQSRAAAHHDQPVRQLTFVPPKFCRRMARVRDVTLAI